MANACGHPAGTNMHHQARALGAIIASRFRLAMISSADQVYGLTKRASRGTSTCALGLPQPVTGSQPGAAW
jgi:hypothetical protein